MSLISLSALGSAALVVNEHTILPACASTLSSMSATINAQAAGADGCEARAWRIAPEQSLDRIQFNTSQSYFEGTDTLDFFAVESDGQLRSLTQHSQPFSASHAIPPVLWLTLRAPFKTDEVVLVLDAPSGGSSFIMHYNCHRPPSSPPAVDGALIGGIVGGIAGMVLIVVLIVIAMKARKKTGKPTSELPQGAGPVSTA